MKKVKLIIILATAIFSSLLQASEQTGKISNIVVRSDGLHYIIVDGPRINNRPNCASKSYWMIKDEESAYGKSQFSMILAAKMSDKTITIYGDNDCHRWGDGEDIKTIEIK